MVASDGMYSSLSLKSSFGRFAIVYNVSSLKFIVERTVSMILCSVLISGVVGNGSRNDKKWKSSRIVEIHSLSAIGWRGFGGWCLEQLRLVKTQCVTVFLQKSKDAA